MYNPNNASVYNKAFVGSITTSDLASFSLQLTNGSATDTITQTALTALQATGKNSVIVQTHGSNTLAVF